MKEIALSRGLVALVDDADFDYVSQFKWTAMPCPNTTYAKRLVNDRTILLHRFIMGAEKGRFVDHINHNGLDNRRENLRFVTTLENNLNTRPRSALGFKGVRKRGTRFAARIILHGIAYHLGHFDSAVEAAKAYDEKAAELFGSYARLNFSADPVPHPSDPAHRQGLRGRGRPLFVARGREVS